MEESASKEFYKVDADDEPVAERISQKLNFYNRQSQKKKKMSTKEFD
jgi:hypothetical protein